MLSEAKEIADAARLHLVHEGDPAPARRPAGAPALEVQIAHREAHHVEIRPRDEIEGGERLRLLLDRERAAVADGDRAVEPGLEHALGHVAEARGAWIAGLVHVQVHRHPALGGRLEQADEPWTKLRMRHDDAAERAVRGGHLVHDRPEGHLVPEHVDAAKVHRLEVDPAPPRRPAAPGRRRRRSCAGGERSRGGVRIARVPYAKAERSANSIRRRTSAADHRAVRSAATARRAESGGAVRIGGAGPDLALVEMGVQINEGGKDHRPLHVHPLAHRSGDDPSSLDGEVEGREATRRPDEAGGCRSGSRA